MAETDVARAEERELGTKPISKLFVKYWMAALSGMIAQIVMVVIEGMIIGNGLGSHGLACVSILLSVELLNTALGSAFGIGVSTAAGARLGSGDEKGAQRAFGQGFWFTVYVSVALTLVIEVFCPQIVSLLGATADIFDDSVIAIRLFVAGFPFCAVGQMLCSMLRVDEHPHAAANIQIGSSVIAISWLAISTFVLGLGVAGAGIYFALTIGVWFVGIYYFVGGRGLFQVRREDMRLEGSLCMEIVKIGLPYFLMQMAGSIYTAVVNNRLGAVGTSEDLAAFAVDNGYVVYIFMLFVQAANFAVQPIASYNYGAKAHKRLRQLVRTSLVAEIAMIGVLTALVCLFAEQVCSLFAGGDQTLIETSAQSTRIIILLSALGYTASVMSSYFECTDKLVIATVLGVSRYIFFTIPAIYVLGGMMGVDGIWWAQPVADVLTFAFTMIFVVRELRRLNPLDS